MFRHTGFTFVELLLVVAILGLSAGVIVGALHPAPRAELRIAAADVAAALRLARNDAWTKGRSSELSLDLGERSLAVNGRVLKRRLPKQVQVSLYTARSELAGARRGQQLTRAREERKPIPADVAVTGHRCLTYQ